VSTTLAIRFPLGRYHANPWDRAVNEGTTEWPPSSWRILRALIAAWHTRWPELPATTVEGLLEALGDPPLYRTPPTIAGHTRHYMPDLDHKKGEQGSTDLTLDSFLKVSPADELLVQWNIDLDAGQREVLGKLAELLPYLGRSESVCEARLRDDAPEPDGSWWHPASGGEVRLLSATRPVSRAALEVTTTEVRKRRRTMPPGSEWVNYDTGGAVPVAEQASAAKSAEVTAIRYAVLGRVPLRATHGVLLADLAHQEVGKLLRRAGVDEERRHQILGTNGARTDHAHAHWIALPGSRDRSASVKYFVVWMPRGLRTDEVQAMLSLSGVSGRRGTYEISGLPQVDLRFQAAGSVEQVAPELCRRASSWQSVTPYLPVRHRKRETADEFLTADIGAELRYRDKPSAEVSRTGPGATLTDRWASEFRRRRVDERLARTPSRPGLGLRLEFPEPVEGPLLLGQLSHFGFGIFEPVVV
jgi:CRISPR-associated protein Csb2